MKASNDAAALVGKAKAATAVLAHQAKAEEEASAENDKVKAALNKAESDQAFAKDVDAKHLAGQASTEVLDAAAKSVDAAKKQEEMTSSQVAQAKSAFAT